MLLRLVSSAILSFAVLSSAVAAPPPTLDARVSAIQTRFGAGAEIRWDASKTRPKGLSGLSVATVGADPADRAARFVRSAADLLALSGDVQAVETRAFRGRHVVRLRQTLAGAPVEGRSAVVRLDADARVTALTSDLGPLSVPTPVSEISQADARQRVSEVYAVTATAPPTRVVIANGPAGRFAWKVPAMVRPLTDYFFVYVDTETGQILRTVPAASHQPMATPPRRAAEVTE